MNREESPDGAKRLIMMDYQHCLDGYNHRDVMVHDIFSKLVQIFFSYVTLVLALDFFAKTSYFLYVCLQVIIGVSGALCLFSYLIKLEANSSCKKALRQRCINIENQVKDPDFQYWHILSTREKYMVEKLTKGRFNELMEKSSGTWFIFCSRILIVLWLIIVILVITCRNTLPIVVH